jgi:hypothetical protein
VTHKYYWRVFFSALPRLRKLGFCYMFHMRWLLLFQPLALALALALALTQPPDPNPNPNPDPNPDPDPLTLTLTPWP